MPWLVQFYGSDGNRLAIPPEPYDESAGVTEIPDGAAYVRLYFEPPEPTGEILVSGVPVYFGRDTDDG